MQQDKPIKASKTRWVLPFLLGALLCFVAIVWWIHPSNRPVATWQQPETLEYSDGFTHYLSVVRGSLDISHLPFSIHRDYYIYTGLENDVPTYGHVVDFTFYYDDYNELEEYIKKSIVQWAEDGVTFRDPSGQMLFFPADVFIDVR